MGSNRVNGKKKYLDENGNEVVGTSTYLDDNGNPIDATTSQQFSDPRAQIGSNALQVAKQGISSGGQNYGTALNEFNPFGGKFNPVAGALNLGVGTAKIAGVPFGMVAEGLRPIPVIGGAVGLVEKGLGAAGEFVGGHFREGVKPLLSPFGQKYANQIAEPFGEAANIGTQAGLTAGAIRGVPAVIRGAGTGIRSAAVGLERSAYQTGELLPKQRQSARYTLDRGIRFGEKGGEKAQLIQNKMNQSVESLADAYTQRGALIDGLDIRNKIETDIRKFHEGDPRRSPSTLKALDKVLSGFDSMLSGKPGKRWITPAEAQKFKTRMNKDLSEFYKKSQSNVISKKATSANLVDESLTRHIRKSLEDIDSRFRGLNIEESQAIKANTSIQEYYRTTTPGTLHAGAVSAARGDPAGMAVNIFGRRPDRSMLAHILDPVGKAMGGKSVSIQGPPPSFPKLPPTKPGGAPKTTPPVPPKQLVSGTTPQQVIESEGLVYRGGNGSGLIFFDDPKTKSTLAIKKGDFSLEAIRKKVAESRKSFGI